MCLRPECGNGLAFLKCDLMTQNTCSNVPLSLLRLHLNFKLQLLRQPLIRQLFNRIRIREHVREHGVEVDLHIVFVIVIVIFVFT